MEATSAPPILLPGIDHLPCLQEIRSVKDKPFYCQSSVGAIPFQGRAVLLLAFCKQNASLHQLLIHMATVCLSTSPIVDTASYWEIPSPPIVEKQMRVSYVNSKVC